MKEADYEARQERRKREREAGVAFQAMLRERLEADAPRIEDLLGRREHEEPGDGNAA